MGYLTRSGKIQTDILNDATPFAGANIALIKGYTDQISLLSRYIEFLPRRGKAVTGTWAYTENASATIWKTDRSVDLAGFFHNDTAAQNDRYDYPGVGLAAGDYTLEVVHAKAPNCGILTIKHGSNTIGTIDMYAVGTTWNNISTINFNIAANTTDVLTLILATKNAASSGYEIYLQRCILFRTA